MFVTLKASKDRSKGATMEQVALSSATQAGSRNRFGSRRVACMGCRSKKLRCTGSRVSCDRCVAQGVPCVLSSKTRTRTRRQTAYRVPHQSTCGSSNESGHVHVAVGELDLTSLVDVAVLSSERGRLNGTGEQRVLSGVEASPGGRSGDESSSEILDASSPFSLLAPDVQTALPDGGSSITAPREMPDTSASTPSFPSVNDSSKTANHSGTLEKHSVSGVREAVSCSCLEDMLEIVRKLDDDEFRLRTLTFDEVLKLQKWTIFHCCKPLDCLNCADLPAASSVILIICEKITEMFRCLSRRIKRQLADGEQLNDFSSDETLPFHQLSSDIGVAYDDASPTHLFDRFSGAPGISTPCNSDMFSPEFKGQYSCEEQLHMSRILAKIQVRNFNQFLLRISEMHESQRNQARFGKIFDLVNRLQQAATSIDATFQRMLQNLMG
ncbi:hypothetical protein FOVG_18543 [Fusarium oxysporum f. sp. pisi HDV247]|uniref:Zn(2)-C6 fungal-type domain-containing protein n=1 Tax=Fusarium oxysporum f. sp. pisi HDV247 TaxID=1080344 RepID=W9NH34_FUSOX|nr:hypothetical protein FOVG_18543 [Fusarium oxysporum f. sp. pisi HDV247]